MTASEIIEAFGIEAEFCKPDRLIMPLTKRRDLHAFLVIDEIVPGKGKIVDGAEHDQIWLSVTIDQLAAAGITESQVVELVRCGVFYDGDAERLSMFV